VLVASGRSVMHEPLLDRKARAARLMEGLPCVRLVDHVVEHGDSMFAAAVQLGLEGIVAKRNPVVSKRSAAFHSTSPVPILSDAIESGRVTARRSSRPKHHHTGEAQGACEGRDASRSA